MRTWCSYNASHHSIAIMTISITIVSYIPLIVCNHDTQSVSIEPLLTQQDTHESLLPKCLNIVQIQNMLHHNQSETWCLVAKYEKDPMWWIVKPDNGNQANTSNKFQAKSKWLLKSTHTGEPAGSPTWKRLLIFLDKMNHYINQSQGYGYIDPGNYFPIIKLIGAPISYDYRSIVVIMELIEGPTIQQLFTIYDWA